MCKAAHIPNSLLSLSLCHHHPLSIGNAFRETSKQKEWSLICSLVLNYFADSPEFFVFLFLSVWIKPDFGWCSWVPRIIIVLTPLESHCRLFSPHLQSFPWEIQSQSSAILIVLLHDRCHWFGVCQCRHWCRRQSSSLWRDESPWTILVSTFPHFHLRSQMLSIPQVVTWSSVRG